MSTQQMMSLHDLVLVNAVDLIRSHWDLDAQAATATLQAMAQETSADLHDVATLTVATLYRPLRAVHL